MPSHINLGSSNIYFFFSFAKDKEIFTTNMDALTI